MKGNGLILCICAGLLLSGGSILGGTTAFSLFRMSFYFWITDLGVELGAGMLFVAGTLLCLPISWLCTIIPFHRRSLPVHGTMMALVMTALVLLSLGMASLTDLSRGVRETAAVNATMVRAMTHVVFDTNIRNSFSAMQLELHCCGVDSFSDWYQFRRTLPPACCGREWSTKKNDQCTVPLYTVGCLRPALSQLRNYSNSLAVLATVIILVLAVALFTDAYMLATSVIEASEAQSPKPESPATPFRVSCLSHSLPIPIPSPAPARVLREAPSTTPPLTRV